MQEYNLNIYGKEFSKETLHAKKFFEENNIKYNYIDIEYDDFYMDMFQAQKILGLPLIKLRVSNREYLCVGFHKDAYVKLLSIIRES